MRHLLLVLAIWLGLAASLPGGATAQEAGPPTPEDSALVRVALVGVLLDSLGPDDARARRIWVEFLAPPDAPEPGAGAGGERRRLRLGADRWAAIESALPTARLAAPGDTLLLCPPGVRAELGGGSGCPIRDDGIIVTLMPVRIEGDSARALGGLLQSAPPGPIALATWAQGCEVVLERVAGVWRLRAIRSRWIT